MNFISSLSFPIRGSSAVGLARQLLKNSPTKIVSVAIAIILFLGVFLFKLCSCSRHFSVNTGSQITPACFSPTPPPSPAPLLSPTPPQKITLEEIQVAITNIKALKRIFNSPEGFDIESLDEDPSTSASSSSENMHNLREGIQAFKTRFERYRGEASLAKAFEALDFMDQTVTNLQIVLYHYREVMRDYRLSMEVDEQGIKRQPDDGNCWLHAALFSLNDMGKAVGVTHETLRTDVVNWMRDHQSDTELLENIRAAMEAHQYVKTNQLNDEKGAFLSMFHEAIITEEDYQEGIERLDQQLAALDAFTIEQYFECMSETGSHGSRAEFYAISKIFNVDVYIWREIDGKLSKEYDQPIISIASEGVIHVVLNARGNHFNSRLLDPV
jgi:hypothetical protein